MINLAQLCLLAAMPSPSVGSFDVTVMTSAPAVFIAVDADLDALPQGANRPTPGRRNPPPSGGTPEPVTMLLLAGGALTYGALRLRGRKNADKNVVKDSVVKDS